MHTGPERDVLSGILSVEIKDLGGVAPELGVVIRSCERGEHERALRNLLASKGKVRRRDAAADLHRRHPPKKLVDRRGRHPLVADDRKLIRMFEELVQAGADEVDRGFVSGNEEQLDLVAQLFLRHTVATVLGVDHGREEIIGGVRRLPFDDVVDESAHLFGRTAGGEDLVVGQHRVKGLDQVAGPDLDRFLVGLRHAQHLGDDIEGQRERKSIDDVSVTIGRHLVEHLVDHLLDPRPERLDRSGGERLADEATQPGVVGRVDTQDRSARLELIELFQQPTAIEHGEVGVGVVDTEFGVAQDREDVVIAEETPLARQQVVNRIRSAHLRQVGPRVLDVPGLQWIEEDLVGGVRHVDEARAPVSMGRTIVRSCPPTRSTSCSTRASRRGTDVGYR